MLSLEGIHHSDGENSIGLYQVSIVGSVCARKACQGVYAIFHHFQNRKRTKTVKTAERSSLTRRRTTNISMTTNARMIDCFPSFCFFHYVNLESLYQGVLTVDVWRKANMASPLTSVEGPIAYLSCLQWIVIEARLAVPLPSPDKCRSFPLYYLALTLAACARHFGQKYFSYHDYSNGVVLHISIWAEFLNCLRDSMQSRVS